MKVTKEQLNFYNKNKDRLIEKYLSAFPKQIDPDTIRDFFIEIGYNRSNVQEFQSICKILTQAIFDEALKRNIGTINKIIFAAGPPATGKSTHLFQFSSDHLIYDGTINDETKFITLIQNALFLGYLVEVWIYSASPKRAFESNLKRGDLVGRYVPISYYEKVANTLNKRELLLEKHFGNTVKIRNFEHTKFEGKQITSLKITINRHELEKIAQNHKSLSYKRLQYVLN
jgi:hypothetical protein